MSYGTIRVGAMYPANSGSQPGIYYTAHTLDTDSMETVRQKKGRIYNLVVSWSSGWG